MKTVKMKFHRDMFFNDMTTPMYKAGEIAEVPADKVERWLKRGAEIAAEIKPVVVAHPEPVVEDKAEVEVEVEDKKPDDSKKSFGTKRKDK